MSLTSRAVRKMLAELSIPAATVEDTRIQLASGPVSGFRVVAPQVGYDKVWFTWQRQWISDDPNAPGAGFVTTHWPALFANANPYTVGVAVITELWDMSRARLLNSPGEYEAFYGMCARSCELFLTTSLQQSLGGPGAAEPVQYARMMVSARSSDAARDLERALYPGAQYPPAQSYGLSFAAATQSPSALMPAPPAATYPNSGASQSAMRVPGVPHPAPGAPAAKPKMGAAAIIGITLSSIVLVCAVVGILFASVIGASNARQDADASTSYGRWLDADVTFVDEPSWQCGQGDDCWTWSVTPAEDCSAVDITFGLGSSMSGASEATETRRVYNWYAGTTTDVVLSLDPQQYEYAGIDEIRCAGR